MSGKKAKRTRKTRRRKGPRRPVRARSQDNQFEAELKQFEAELNELRAILDRVKEHPMQVSERDKLMAFVERLELVDAELASPNGTTERLRELVSKSMFEGLPSERRQKAEEDKP